MLGSLSLNEVHEWKLAESSSEKSDRTITKMRQNACNEVELKILVTMLLKGQLITNNKCEKKPTHESRISLSRLLIASDAYSVRCWYINIQ